MGLIAMRQRMAVCSQRKSVEQGLVGGRVAQVGRMFDGTRLGQKTHQKDFIVPRHFVARHFVAC